VPEEKLTIKMEAQDASGTAKGVESVAEAEAHLKDRHDEAGAAAEASAKAQGKLNASQEDFLAILRRIHPALGDTADGLLRMVRVSGELASKQIDLNTVTAIGTQVFTKYAGAIKLLGAVSVALVGLKLLTDAIKRVKEDAEASKKALEDLGRAQTELQGEAISGAEDVAANRAKTRATYRRAAPFTAEETQSIEETLRAAPEAMRAALRPLLEEFGGAKGFGPGAGPFTGGQLESLARLGFDPSNIAPSQRERVARRFLERNEDAARALRDADRGTGERRRAAAAKELFDPSGGQASLERIIEEIVSGSGADPEVVRQAVTNQIKELGDFRKLSSRDRALKRLAGREESFFIRDEITGQGFPSVEVGGEKRRLNPVEVQAADAVLARLLPAIEALTGAAKQLRRTTGEQKPTVNISYPNARIIGRSAREQEKLRLNAQTRAAVYENL
jgi:hypothetical protein